ncbi:hypothetical protein QBZ16_001279 [Prototheca wickerhamii]|uniref:tRNA-dihydrouridine(16/17) synthase [NAD(P)(+)] n=1 Tax=Prototheca wickerhamii TaxID=3111 RepID=A0AAD9IEE7_PROWI|nr:hypothetical protein QBZ16_001279 [Prototheca wickerhamii]
MSSKANSAESVPQAEAAWAWFRDMGAPKYWVAPMVDQSELPFRMLCRRYGSTGAYSPMLHARLFLESKGYREEHFTTCDRDRPLLAQFCANDPDILLAAAREVEDVVDAVDLNLGCPQRIARRGHYGAFLMDDEPLVVSLVERLAKGLSRAKVTVKIRRFDDVARTVAYAAALERAGAYLVAVHGRTREQKTASAVAAEWEHIAAVKAALRVPVLANGNILSLADADRCMAETGADGVLSAEPLLADPGLFWDRRRQPGGDGGPLEGCRLLLEYLDLCDVYPVPYRMVKGHAFRMIGPWLSEHTDLRDLLNRGPNPCNEMVRELVTELMDRIEDCGRDHPIPAISEKKLAKLAAEEAKQAAIAEQLREEEAMAALSKAAAEGKLEPAAP